jgi:hypothetical protein
MYALARPMFYYSRQRATLYNKGNELMELGKYSIFFLSFFLFFFFFPVESNSRDTTGNYHPSIVTLQKNIKSTYPKPRDKISVASSKEIIPTKIDDYKSKEKKKDKEKNYY